MIEVSHLTKNYGPRPAIMDLNFGVQAGEIVGFLGPNGAGKTTTMKILTGFMPSTFGTAKVADFDVWDNPIDVKRNIGYLPETPPVYNDMRVTDYLRFAAKLRGIESSKLDQVVSNAVDKTGLGDVRNRLIGNLSKGFKQRVGLAQAIAHNPKVLVLDEPTVGLDPRQIIEIRDLIKSLAGDHTVILSTHILQEVTHICARIIVISQGRIVAQESLEKLTAQQRYSMMVKSPKPDGIEAIRGLDGVKDLSVAGSKLIMEIDSSKGEIRDKIVETAVSKGMGVFEFSTGKVSLEEVFLQLTSQ